MLDKALTSCVKSMSIFLWLLKTLKSNSNAVAVSMDGYNSSSDFNAPNFEAVSGSQRILV